MSSRRVATTLVAAVLAALGACSKEVGNNAQTKPSVGAKIDRAIDRTQERLSTAGEKAKEDVQQAAEKTQEALSKAQQSLQSSSIPYSPRQPVTPGDPAASAAANPGANASPNSSTGPNAKPNANASAGASPSANASASTPASITTTLTTGPETKIKIMSGTDAPR